MQTQEWLYARLYHVNHSHGEYLLTSFLPAWADEGQRFGAERWFFIRYVDPSGPHIRVRFQGRPDVLDNCYTTGNRLWQEMKRPRVPAEQIMRLHPRAEPAAWGRGHHRLSFGLYGREYHRYGASNSMELAENLFQHSSEFSLQAITTTGPDRLQRAQLAMNIMQGFTSSLSPTQQTRFWQFHWKYWTAALEDNPALMRQTERAAMHWRPILTERPTRSHPPDDALTTAATVFGRALTDGVRSALRTNANLNAHQLLLMHLHMTLNRLGYLPLEEAVLGRIAASQTPHITRPTGQADTTHGRKL